MKKIREKFAFVSFNADPLPTIIHVSPKHSFYAVRRKLCVNEKLKMREKNFSTHSHCHRPIVVNNYEGVDIENNGK